MKAILGLGNPGPKYRFSRHNIGFTTVRRLAKAKAIRLSRRACNCLLGEGVIDHQQVLLGLPLTLMNLSGKAVASLVRKKSIELADLLVVLDDINLPLGKIRLRAQGSSGGHKGLGSIIEALGTEAFPRLRIGIGKPAGEAKRYVLGNFSRAEKRVINAAIGEAESACQLWVKEGIKVAMNRFNRKGD